MSKVLKIALAILASAVLFSLFVPVFAQDAKDKPASSTAGKPADIPVSPDKVKALDDVKAAFEKAQKDAELAQAKLEAAQEKIKSAQLQFVLIVEAAKKDAKCDDCQLSEDGKSLKKTTPANKGTEK